MAELSLGLLLLLAISIQGEPAPVFCPKGVSRFSASNLPNHYYSCEQGGSAVLTECPAGKVYHGYSQKCRSEDESDTPKPYDEKAMARPVVLGALYNARTSHIDTRYLWDHDTIVKHKMRYPRKETTTSFSTDTKSIDKADKFDISANLKMDFMSGQVAVQGAMQYLTDEVESEKELNVAMMYHTTKFTETIPKWTDNKDISLCGSKEHTHVITSVTYGIDANFVFKYLLSDRESKENIFGELSLTVTAVPGLSITGSGSVNLTESQTEMMEHTHVSIMMDGGDGCTVTSFEQALACYADLPRQGGTAENDYAGTAILDFHLSPLTDICVEADFLLNDINDELIEQITNMLDELEQIGVKANGLAMRGPCQDCGPWAKRFPPIGENLDEFQGEWRKKKLSIQGSLQHIIPNIRNPNFNGTGGEDELSSLLQDYADSVFAFEKSNEFLTRRNREISAVFHLSESFPEDVEDDNRNIVMYDYKAANDVGQFLEKDFVILLELKILSPLSLTEDFLDGREQVEDGFWFNDIETNGQIGSLVRKLSKFAWENDNSDTQGYLVQLLEITDGSPDINVQAYKNGVPESEPFEIPSAPEQPSIYHISHNSIKLTVTRASQWTTGVRVYISDAYDVTNVLERSFSFEDLPSGEEMEIEFNCSEAMDCLEAISLYTATVKYETQYGRSPPSKASLRFLTAPSSPPTSLAVTAVTTDTLSVSWNEPNEMGRVNETDVLPRDLSYSVVLNGINGYSETKFFEEPTFETIFVGLQDASKYIVEARAFFKETSHYHYATTTTTSTTTTTAPTTTSATSGNTTTTPAPRGLRNPLSMTSRSLPTSCASYSQPTTPTMLPPLPGEVSLDSITVRWEAPQRLPQEATEISYTLAYASQAEDGSLGTFIEVENLPDTTAVINGLTMDTQYALKAKVLTNEGTSEFSQTLTIRTMNNQTDLGKFEDQVMDVLNDLKEEAKKKSVFCASQDLFDADAGGTITYDKVFFESSTIPAASMDHSSGKFVAGAAGSYMVSFSMEMGMDPGQTQNIWVQKQGAEELPGSRMTGISSQDVFFGLYDNGSKDIVVELKKGDELSLYAEASSSLDLSNIVFCVKSLKVKVE